MLLLDTGAGAGTEASGLEMIGTGAESNIPEVGRDEDTARGMLDEVSLSKSALLVCGGDGIIESRVLVSGNDACSWTVS